MIVGFSESTPQEVLAALLERHAPARLLVLGSRAWPALEAYCSAHADAQPAFAPPGPLPADLAAQRFDLALLVDCLEHLPRRTGLELVGGLRNLNANRLALLLDLASGDWSEADFFALGLQASERFVRGEQTLTLFTYDLHDYKQVPDWLNAKHWANPQNFGKYWW